MEKFPYVLMNNYISVVINGQPFALNSTHPTFARLKSAIQKEDWTTASKLVSLARAISVETEGSLELTNNGLFYKGLKVEDQIGDRIVELVRQGKSLDETIKLIRQLRIREVEKKLDGMA